MIGIRATDEDRWFGPKDAQRDHAPSQDLLSVLIPRS
jgi:hypothetical protein